MVELPEQNASECFPVPVLRNRTENIQMYIDKIAYR